MCIAYVKFYAYVSRTIEHKYILSVHLYISLVDLSSTSNSFCICPICLCVFRISISSTNIYTVTGNEDVKMTYKMWIHIMNDDRYVFNFDQFNYVYIRITHFVHLNFFHIQLNDSIYGIYYMLLNKNDVLQWIDKW